MPPIIGFQTVYCLVSLTIAVPSVAFAQSNTLSMALTRGSQIRRLAEVLTATR